MTTRVSGSPTWAARRRMAATVALTWRSEAPPTSGMSSGGWGQIQPCMTVPPECVRQALPRRVVEVAPVTSISTIAPGSVAPVTFAVTFCRVRPRRQRPSRPHTAERDGERDRGDRTRCYSGDRGHRSDLDDPSRKGLTDALRRCRVMQGCICPHPPLLIPEVGGAH